MPGKFRSRWKGPNMVINDEPVLVSPKTASCTTSFG